MTPDDYNQLAKAAESAPGWSNKTSEGAYTTCSAAQVFEALNLSSFAFPDLISRIAKALPRTATMLGGHLAGSLLNTPFNDIDIWCVTGDGSPHKDTVAAVEAALPDSGGYTKQLSKGGTTIFVSQTMPPVMVHSTVFESVNALLDTIDLTINQIATRDTESFVCGPCTLEDLQTKTLRYTQPPTARSPLIRELRNLRLRKYIKRGFTPDPSVADAIRSFSPLLANQLEAQRARQSVLSQQAVTPSILPPVKPPSTPLTPEIPEPDPQPAQVPVGDPVPNVESRVTDNPFMKQFAAALQSK